ncbi:MAG: RNA polymerase sigma factor [Verrucomicrobiota bacterium JB023]|nr:RNA polymerase sigma factor [Verrucomicrobiota bacterium JB023]
MSAPPSKSEFEELVDTYYEALYRFGYSLAKSPERASDLVQQTFVKWAEKGHQLLDKTKAKSWLFTTLYREHLSQARRSTRFPERDLEEAEFQLPAESPSPERALDGKRAVSLLTQLDETFRAPLTLFYLQDHSYKEIAAILDIPIGTVMSRIARGKKQLRDRMNTASGVESKNIVNITKGKQRHG